MILVIGDKHYPSVAVDALTIRHTLALQRELVLMDIDGMRTMADVRTQAESFAAASKDERAEHPHGLFLTALALWAARVSAGDDVTLAEVMDLPMSYLASMRTIAEPHDRQEPDAAGKGQPRPSTGGTRKTSSKKSRGASRR